MNPRDQAWGAWHSSQSNRRQTIPLLEDVVVQRFASAGIAETAALDTALDALIRLDAQVRPDLLLAIRWRRPAQALLLLSRGGDRTSRALLALVNGAEGLPWYAAANVLLARKVRRLTQALLERLTLEATIVVSDDGSIGFGSGGRAGGMSCGGIGTAPGLPPWPSYELTGAAQPDGDVLARGPVPVYYRRRVSAAGEVPAHSQQTIGGPRPEDLLAYVAAQAAIAPSAMPVRAHESSSVAWRGSAALEDEIARIRSDVGRRYGVLLSRLVSQDLLTRGEAGSLRPPELTVRVRDQRTGRSVPLREPPPELPHEDGEVIEAALASWKLNRQMFLLDETTPLCAAAGEIMCVRRDFLDQIEAPAWVLPILRNCTAHSGRVTSDRGACPGSALTPPERASGAIRSFAANAGGWRSVFREFPHVRQLVSRERARVQRRSTTCGGLRRYPL